LALKRTYANKCYLFQPLQIISEKLLAKEIWAKRKQNKPIILSICKEAHNREALEQHL